MINFDNLKYPDSELTKFWISNTISNYSKNSSSDRNKKSYCNKTGLSSVKTESKNKKKSK